MHRNPSVWWILEVRRNPLSHNIKNAARNMLAFCFCPTWGVSLATDVWPLHRQSDRRRWERPWRLSEKERFQIESDRVRSVVSSLCSSNQLCFELTFFMRLIVRCVPPPPTNGKNLHRVPHPCTNIHILVIHVQSTRKMFVQSWEKVLANLVKQHPGRARQKS